ncbi:hypothetical protein [Novosphingobium sp.]|uniref:hypothetical protein n=1 Tax=Novosphingobium sp. TaxID=1874826 RepID=UPI0031D4A735
MADQTFLRQAQQDAENLKKLSESTKRRLDSETDWNGYRMRGYEFPQRVMRMG